MIEGLVSDLRDAKKEKGAPTDEQNLKAVDLLVELNNFLKSGDMAGRDTEVRLARTYILERVLGLSEEG